MNYTLPDNGGNNIRFGRDLGGSFNGVVDELRISNRARTGAEVLATYLAGGIGVRPVADPTQRAAWSDVDVDKDGNMDDL